MHEAAKRSQGLELESQATRRLRLLFDDPHLARNAWRTTMRTTGPALGLILGAVYALAALPAAAQAQPEPDGRKAAAMSLLESAKRDLSAGRAEQAAAQIERALRIDPSNPTLWHYLSLARLELGDATQAAAMAAKSRNLTASTPPPRRSLREVAGDWWSSARSIGRPDDEVATWSSRRAFDTARSQSWRAAPQDDGAPVQRYRDSLPDNCRVVPAEPRAGRRSQIVRCEIVDRAPPPRASSSTIASRAGAATERRYSRTRSIPVIRQR